MNLMEIIKRRILKFLGLEQLNSNPYAERLTFISDEENIIRQNIEEFRMWYIGNSDELLNYYTNEQLYGSAREPIYNRNRRNYFWGISSQEGDIKRVHSGIPNAIITTLVNAIGNCQIKTKDAVLQAKIDTIIDKTDLLHLINQQQMPLTMVEGWGAWKVNFNLDLAKYPLLEYYEAQNVDFMYKSGILLGIIYKDYYRFKNENYCLVETRSIKNGNSCIEYQLFRYNNKNEATEVPLETIPELADLKNIEIPNLKRILGVPSKFFFNPLNKDYGRSLFDGKIDLFDDLDQILSQDSQTIRVSTPVEYYPVDLLERQRNGLPQMPKVFNRQFIKLESTPDGDGNSNGTIQTTQPELHIEQYSEDAKHKLDFILTGILSPATMGIDIAKKDNAEAQREKEKATYQTVKDMQDYEQDILPRLFTMIMAVDDLITNQNAIPQETHIQVMFSDYGTPTRSERIEKFMDAYLKGAMSLDRYIHQLFL